MKAPLCKLCGHDHFLTQPHVWGKTEGKPETEVSPKRRFKGRPSGNERVIAAINAPVEKPMKKSKTKRTKPVKAESRLYPFFVGIKFDGELLGRVDKEAAKRHVSRPALIRQILAENVP